MRHDSSWIKNGRLFLAYEWKESTKIVSYDLKSSVMTKLLSYPVESSICHFEARFLACGPKVYRLAVEEDTKDRNWLFLTSYDYSPPASVTLS